MKKILAICFLVSGIFVFCSSCRAQCEMRAKGVVYLHVLDENGTPLPDSYGKNLIVRHSDRDGYQGNSDDNNPSLVFNENDKLIFQLGNVQIIYNDCKRLKNLDTFTDEEIKNALKGAGIFTIRDKTDMYKTVVDAKYSDCLLSIEKVLKSDFVYFDPKYIYNCQIKLEKK